MKKKKIWFNKVMASDVETPRNRNALHSLLEPPIEISQHLWMWSYNNINIRIKITISLTVYI